MKKEFMEPEMRRIELNLKERIAESTLGYGEIGGYRTQQAGPETCTAIIIETSITSGDFNSGKLSDAQLGEIYRSCRSSNSISLDASVALYRGM